MCMVQALAILLAVLCAATGARADVNTTRVRRTPQPHHNTHRALMDEEMEAAAAWKRSYWRAMQTIIRNDAHDGYVECCPSIVEMIAPKGGRTLSGLYVELYEDKANKQQLYELSCAPEVVDRPCRFIDARLYNQSRCVQKYSYTYALVRNPPPTKIHRHRREGLSGLVPPSRDWSLDYIRVRAGCECQITPPKRKRHRPRRRNKRIEDDDET